MFCFYLGSAKYRVGNGRVTIGDLNPTLCTHLVYQHYTLSLAGAVQDVDTNELKQLLALKASNPWMKVLVSVGGPTLSSKTISGLVKNITQRRLVVKNLIALIVNNALDGLDIAWFYPVLLGGEPGDRDLFVQLLLELNVQLRPAGKLLTISVAPTKDFFPSAYNVPEIDKYVDYVNVMAFDLHASWDGRTGLNSPVYRALEETTRAERELNVDFILTGWTTAGIATDKIILCVSANGHSYRLADSTNNKLRDRSIGPGTEGPYLGKQGDLSYLESCEMLKAGGWTKVWDDRQKAYYAYKSDQWISYETVESLTQKIDLAKSYQVGGLGMWNMEGDDIKNVCGGGHWPLMMPLYSSVYPDGWKFPNSEIPTTTSTTPKPTTTTTTTTAKTTVKPTTTTTPSPPVVLPEYCPTSGFVRDPVDCATFYRCIPGAKFAILSKSSCGAGTYFDTKILTCNWASFVQC